MASKIYSTLIFFSEKIISHRYLGLIIADDADWGDIADDVEFDFEQTKMLYPRRAVYANDLRSVHSSERDNGLKIRLNFFNDDMDDVKIYLDYDENGVLEYGELDYGGVTVMTIDLDKGLAGWLEDAFESGTAQAIIGTIIAVAGIATAVIIAGTINKKRAEGKLYLPAE